MARRNIKIDLRLSEQEMERLRRDVARSAGPERNISVR